MKKIFSIITALALCLSLLPTTALATGSVTIDLSGCSGKEIKIDSDGYTIEDSEKVSHMGSYVLTGSTTNCSVP